MLLKMKLVNREEFMAYVRPAKLTIKITEGEAMGVAQYTREADGVIMAQAAYHYGLPAQADYYIRTKPRGK